MACRSEIQSSQQLTADHNIGGVGLFGNIRRDIRLIKERDPAARSAIEVLLTYPSLTAIRSYRIAHWFHIRGMKTIARMISQRARNRTGIEIHPGATIGKGLFIDHGMGVVIGETAVVGNNCLLYQGVTLGGTGKDKGKRGVVVRALPREGKSAREQRYSARLLSVTMSRSQRMRSCSVRSPITARLWEFLQES